ncbi:thiol-disulfide oxidoreductase ResA [Alkalicoccus urumqiensis]|uniref:Alkyl hydroperoxide reductase n=1 Tax=Alkalicoccus urumqiensis TaxID=1548213 RepID=A0A2P6MKG4_ALKUR|nr:thiol-disulfide oxidoreductase ResA [Alkalicoccus urumqiensis]PRO66777.1 alkyl hydroperoxide reductase [Alkalicoccus urumqiensis]
MKTKRRMTRAIILFVMIAAIGYTFYNHFSEERGLVDSGDEAPNFILENMQGEELELAEMEGQGVYLNFWATYCTYCRDKMEILKEYYEEYEQKGVQVIHVNVDETNLQVERHRDRYNLPYELYIDRNMLVSNAYGVGVLPSAFLINEEGEVVERQIGGKTEEQLVSSLEEIVPGS